MYFWELCAAHIKSGLSLYKNSKKKKSKPSVKLPFFFFCNFFLPLLHSFLHLYIRLVNDVSNSNCSRLFHILPNVTQSSCDWSRVMQFVRAEVTLGWITGLSLQNLSWHFKHICKQRTCCNRKNGLILSAGFILANKRRNSIFFFFKFASGVAPWHLQGCQTPEPPKNHSATGKEWDSLQELQIEVIIHLTAQSWQMMSC